MAKVKNIIGCILLAATIFTAGCGAPQKVSKEHFAMGTFIDITFYNTRHAKHAQACFDYIDILESQISLTQPGSQVYKLNEQGEASFEGDVAEIITIAKDISYISGRAFEINILPLKELWDIENKSDGDAPPAWAEVIDSLPLLDRVYIQNDKGAYWATSGVGAGIDLGGIAKGYAGDRCAEILRENGVDNAIINMGGNVRTVGDREFRIGLRNPRGEDGELYGVVTVGECNVITSGDYERYFETDGVRYHHIFDPSTGYPANSGLLSATVIGDSGAEADALSTAIFVLGHEYGLELAASLSYEAVVVTEEFEVYATEGIRPALEITADGFTLI